MVDELKKRLFDLMDEGLVNPFKDRLILARKERDFDKLKDIYDEYILKLEKERAAALKIASDYQKEFDNMKISDDDITYLSSTINRIIELMKEFPGATGGLPEDAVKVILSLINIDTLRSMQLLGFNYKEAIGEPLTKVTAEFIEHKLSVAKTNVKKK